VTKPFAVGQTEVERARLAAPRQLLAYRLFDRDDLLDDALDDLAGGFGCVGRARLLGFLLHRRERLGHLAVVAIDGDGLEAQAPCIHVQLLDVFHRNVFGHVDGLGDRAGNEGLYRSHHPHVTGVVNRVVAHRAGEHGHMLRREMRRAQDRLLFRDVGDDVVDLRFVVTEAAQRTRDRLVDDRHRSAADELLHLHQPEVGLDAGGVAVHEEPDGARGGQHARLRVPHAERGTEIARAVPRLLRGRQHRCGHELFVDVRGLLAMHVEHPQHVLAVLGETGEGAHAGGGARRDLIGVTRHERG